MGGIMGMDRSKLATAAIAVTFAASVIYSASAAGTADLEQVKAFVAKAMSPRTAAESQLPTSGPKGKPGKSLISIVCAASIEGCRAISDAQVEAAKAIGWNARIIDGLGSPKGWNDAMQAAIESKPDVIALAAVLPSAISESLADAKRAGITVVCTQCGVSPGQVGIDAADGDEVNAIIGEYLGSYIVAKAGGKANILMWYYPEFAISKLRHDAAKKVFLEKCDCKTQSIEVKISEWTTTLPDRVQTILLQNPDINWIYSPADETAIDATNGIKAAGLSGKVRVAGGNGNLQALAAIKSDPDYAATAAVSYAFSSWSSIDNANRVLNGEKPVTTRTSVRLVDASNVGEIPKGQYYGGDVDFRSVYKKIWGAK
jgi:ribose transport system substrate-binding protein